MTFALAFLALFIEALAGYPEKLVARIGHPVGWMSALVRRAAAAWNERSLSLSQRRLRGVLALATVLLVGTSCVLLLDRTLDLLLPVAVALIAKAILASTLIAGRSLDERVSAVADALDERGVNAGRTALAPIVERDTAALDEAGVSRAAIESLAGGFSEGVVAPLMWLAILGLPGCALYKTVSTAGSMSSQSPDTDGRGAYGWAAVRLDEAVNMPSARLSALWLAAAARIMPGADWRSALMSAVRDGPRHRERNAGWPEAAMAGALGLTLAGPTDVGGRRIDNSWMGSGRRALTAADIHRALRLYRIAYVVQAAAIGLIALILLIVF
ncbi:cobalamin biosynthesis protein CobD [Hyphomicrobium nitrativorans NL23]|uniref:Cobalamin biosynthesis protein CobD n=1 Tax=Hyphomicrobium nitrativorans NL23 TaxID=1029756 RepID=V5SE17_9HYPH|nr:CobD/CbiB family cobalamin biosynthesis protein [Hyphomicrobium nitrativorans]AHB49121.1 cobalamin biosynthesis protein CobD [Hyphomicrobium nitrativorans NL23]